MIGGLLWVISRVVRNCVFYKAHFEGWIELQVAVSKDIVARRRECMQICAQYNKANCVHQKMQATVNENSHWLYEMEIHIEFSKPHDKLKHENKKLAEQNKDLLAYVDDLKKKNKEYGMCVNTIMQTLKQYEQMTNNIWENDAMLVLKLDLAMQCYVTYNVANI